MIHLAYLGSTRTFCGAKSTEDNITHVLDKMTCLQCYENARKSWIA